MYTRTSEINGVLCLTTLLGFGNLALAGPKPETALEKIFYDIGVIGYCAMGTDSVKAGFQRELNSIVEREGRTDKQVKTAYNRSLDLVHWEWDNRGLGGFRGWCKTEGQAAVERFLAVPE